MRSCGLRRLAGKPVVAARRRKMAQGGAITLIQLFGSARNLNVHFAVHVCTNAARIGDPDVIEKIRRPSPCASPTSVS